MIIKILLLVIGWIFLNVIVKLLVNSVDRVYRDNIDTIVKKTPTFLKLLVIEIFRICLILILLPNILFISVTPRKFRHNEPFFTLAYVRTTLFSKNFRVIAQTFPFFISHPLLWFGRRKYDNRINQMERELLTIFVVLFCLVACAAILIWLFASTEWDGWMDWTFRITVLDAGTRKPVSTATSRIVVANETSFGQIESFIEPDTALFPANASGVCLVTSPFPCYGHKSRFKSTAFMNFRHRNLRVEAPGYQRFERPLKTIVTTPLEYKSLSCTTNVEVALTHAE